MLRHLDHVADEPGVRHDRVVQLDAVRRAGADDDLLHERRRRLRDDVRGHVTVVAREAAAVDEVELLAKGGVLARRCGILGRLLPKLVDLAAELVVLGLGVDEVGKVAVGVAERARDAVGSNLEGA